MKFAYFNKNKLPESMTTSLEVSKKDNERKKRELIKFLHDIFREYVKEYRSAISINQLAEQIIKILK